MLKLSQEKTHSAPSHQPKDKAFIESVIKKDHIAWPSMNESDLWAQLDNRVNCLLIGSPTIYDRVALLESTILSQASSLFGYSPPPKRGLKGLNRRARHSIQLVIEKNNLQSQINSCPDESLKKIHLQNLLESVRRQLRNIRRGESNRKRRWKIKQAHKAFLKNPYEAGKQVLEPHCQTKLKCDKVSLDAYKVNNLFDQHHHIPLPTLDDLPPAPPINFEFNSSNLKRDDFFSLLRSRRNGSAPGVNGIPYKVYKKCPKIASFLFKIFLSCMKLSVVPVQWRVASETYIPKADSANSSKIEDFRPIALLNVEGKLFFSLVSKRLEEHIIHKNQFINVSIQKGCMEKVPGCWEHMSMVWDELKSSKIDKLNITAVWLDIANAYGSVPHQLIFMSLKRYGVHPLWIEIIKSYYGGLWSCCFSPQSPSSWHQHFRGIFTGCTASIILFLSAINVVIEYICVGLDIYNKPPPVKAFMDDIFLKAETSDKAQCLLNRANTALSWARMKLKSSKSKCLIIEKGKVQHNKFLSITSMNKTENVSSIFNNPVKFLGRSITFEIKDKDQAEALKLAVIKGLSLIDKSSHRGVHKLWILHHLLVPRLRWPLLIYEIPISVVLSLERRISTMIRKWLKLHSSTTNICLYSASSPCPLPLKSLTSVMKSSKVSGHLLLRDSSDRFVSDAKVELKSGAWSVSDEVKKAESILDFKKVLGYHQTSRAGFGSHSTPEVPPKRSHEYRKLISSIVEETNESSIQAKAVQLSLQGQWTRWCNYVQFDLSWKTILGMPPSLLSFCLGATYNTLPSPSNLHRWNITTEQSCCLCLKSICTIPHILGACKIALQQGRFTYRHDSVLAVLVSSLKEFLTSRYRKSNNQTKRVNFVKEGTKITKSMKTPYFGLLHQASDWKVLHDLSNKLVIPPFLAISELRPDILMYSLDQKICIIIELTCPCEENMEQWHSNKFHKYDPLCESIKLKGWAVHLFPVEVGARGFAATTVKSCLSRLGFCGKLLKSTLKALSIASLKASFYIWVSRDSKHWEQPPIIMSSSYPPDPDLSSSSQNKVTPKPPRSHHKYTSIHPADIIKGGLLNKGNTCYLSSCLQCLHVMSEFWSRLSGKNTLSPFTSSFLRIMSLLKSTKSPIDPSQLIKYLKQVLIISGRPDIDLFQQQDACEILQCILQELFAESLQVSELTQCHVKSIITCSTCHQSNVKEDPFPILQLPVSNSIQDSISAFLRPEELSGSNLYFCNLCSALQPAILEHQFSRVGEFLIIQLKRFLTFSNTATKNTKLVNCIKDICVPVVFDNDITHNKKFELIATINHSGNLNRGHYTAHVSHKPTNSWFHCNDTAVVPCQKSVVNNASAYVLFFRVTGQ